MKIAVAGVGYVGLVTAVTLADVGHDVICLDVDKGKLKMLKEGIVSEEEYRQIDTIFLEKYKPVFGTLFSDISLTSEP